jgi:hypothetical protein
MAILRMRLSALVLLAVGLGTGCERPEGAASAIPAGAPMTERRALVASPTKLGFGETCDATGDDGCASGLCFKTFGGVGEGHRCTKACAGDGECGSGWRCVAIVPSLPETYCMPPQLKLEEVTP